MSKMRPSRSRSPSRSSESGNEVARTEKNSLRTPLMAVLRPTVAPHAAWAKNNHLCLLRGATAFSGAAVPAGRRVAR